MESILTSVKKLLGIEEEYEHFDADIIISINSALSVLTQIGVGSPDGFSITDKTAVWTDFIPNSPALELIKSYTHLRVKLVFDPPTSSFVIESINKTIGEFEWRIQVMLEAEQTT
ncbi:hypothetical protein AGMMS49975_11810 [Clostridia bacterium]|nr:hypothetical protein AGMMS49975_11810 [Clostridia bacterium]